MKKQQQLFVVHSLQSPGPKWVTVSEPLQREAAASIVAAQWAEGRKARRIPSGS